MNNISYFECHLIWIKALFFICFQCTAGGLRHGDFEYEEPKSPEDV